MNENTLFIIPTDMLEVQQIIKELKDNKKGGIDGINSNVIKMRSPYISKVLAHIINLCIEKSIWPDNLKVAEVIPIYKNGSKKEVSNYRPISLISKLKIFWKNII